jgi:pilus assembly protein Flp/PilA
VLRHGSEHGAQGTVKREPGAENIMEFEMTKFVRFVKDESGATAIEYGLIAAAMGVALITAMPFLADAISGKFQSLAEAISSGVQ